MGGAGSGGRGSAAAVHVKDRRAPEMECQARVHSCGFQYHHCCCVVSPGVRDVGERVGRLEALAADSSQYMQELSAGLQEALLCLETLLLTLCLCGSEDASQMKRRKGALEALRHAPITCLSASPGIVTKWQCTCAQ